MARIKEKHTKLFYTFLNTKNKLSKNEINHIIYKSIKKNKIIKNNLNKEDIYIIYIII